eukprot:Tamp_24025.p1 GENE.Tamp_24025~~Tamp_24025.p1  ORF type:complete len:249 (+),score=24.36 Tamp_24025:3-749(+)
MPAFRAYMAACCLVWCLAGHASAFQAPLPQSPPRSVTGATAAGACMALEKADPLPPTLSAPVFSLATLNDDGTTNMNILTYAVPVGIRPTRKWIISLWQGTLSHHNFSRRRKGVLQLLRRRHVALISILGKQSGSKVPDKAAQCAAAGFEWQALLSSNTPPSSSASITPKPASSAHPLLLPNCAAYYPLTFPDDQEYQNAGEHDAALCALDGVYVVPGDKGIEDEREGEEQEDIVMCTAWLRSQGVIE